MNIAAIVFTICLPLAFPFLAKSLEKRPGFPVWLSAVVMCYAIGILGGNFLSSFVNEKMANDVATGAMIVALPLLLFGAKIKENWQLAGPGLKAFGLCALAGFISTCVAAWLFNNQQEDGWVVAGMLTGLYTGGTPNLQAIGTALEAPGDYVVLLQAADIIGGGIFLLLLMTVIHPFLGWFLPSFQISENIKPETEVVKNNSEKKATWEALLLSLFIGGAAVGLTYLFIGPLKENATAIILLLTSFSLAASFLPSVSNWKNSYTQGEYFLFVFCVALGLLADFRTMIAEGLPLLAFSLVALICTILLHWLLCWLFRVDRDTAMISITAALYGPVFIAQITTAISNKKLLAPGIALSLIGLALGTYLGIGIAHLAHWLFW